MQQNMCETHHDIEAERQRTETYLALLRTFRRHIENYCVSHSNCREDAEDMMQEVFITVWENIGQMRSDSSPKQVNRWLQKVMRTVFGRSIRRKHIDDNSPLSAAMGMVNDDHADRQLLEELMAHLPPDDRQLLQERLDGYSNVEIAERLGILPNTLNKRMSRILTKMKEIYSQLYETK